MKRSEINMIIRDMEKLCKKQGFHLPAFASWTPEDWQNAGHEYDEIRDNKLGWDITDFGLDDFWNVGFGLFTIRNGNYNMPDKYPKTYAEKLLAMYPKQECATHYHVAKMEDIVNRGGNDLYMKVWNGTKDLEILDTDVTVMTDGKKQVVPAGTAVRLRPGESITVTPYMFHRFVAPPEGEMVLIGEVSMCNDDDNDNYFCDPKVGRFPAIEEDEPPYRLLCTEYPEAK